MNWRILKTKIFARAAAAEGLTDVFLKKSIQEIQLGLIGSSLGGNLLKKRVAIGSKGKSGGLRTILVYKAPSDKIFCLYVFAKSEQENIGLNELKALKKTGARYLNMTDKEIQAALDAMELLEVDQNADTAKESQPSKI